MDLWLTQDSNHGPLAYPAFKPWTSGLPSIQTMDLWLTQDSNHGPLLEKANVLPLHIAAGI
ncbi:hypothetical protein DPMN_021437 [Dreissena polymorpha]|uniref:Uncharacterized protein n=1 Tax=Dreissena polymorpha TaxID=45954 RepID=A0A9D4NMU4_DREPO|nr:hypothetical protein DPMN_021437 [Dreissena polymorpha]